MFNQIRQVIEDTANQPALHVRRKDLEGAYQLVKTISSDTLENTMCEVSTFVPGGDRPNVPAFAKSYTKEKVDNLGKMLQDTVDNYPKSDTIAAAAELRLLSLALNWRSGSANGVSRGAEDGMRDRSHRLHRGVHRRAAP